MKTQRRHELETNVLAARLARWIDRIKPYTNVILTVTIVVLVVAMGAWWTFQQSYRSESKAWTAYYEAVAAGPNYDKLREVAEQYGNTPVEQWANLTLADAMLLDVSNQMFIDRAHANGLLDQIRSTCRMLQTNSQNPEIRSRASYCLARAFEMEGRLDKAKEEYENVQGVFQPLAKQHLAALEKPEAREFYEWFASAEPRTPSAPQGPGVPGQRPLFDPSPLESGSREGSAGQSDLPLSSGFGLGTDDTGRYDAGPLPADGSSAGSSPAETPPAEGGPSIDLFPKTDDAAPSPSPEGASPTDTQAKPDSVAPADSESSPMSDTPPETAPSPESAESSDNAAPAKQQPAPDGADEE